jgi:hypothetical protein
MADKDKKRFDKEMETYIPPPPESSSEEEEEEEDGNVYSRCLSAVAPPNQKFKPNWEW